jgi:Xaa-Pro dipeptidase
VTLISPLGYEQRKCDRLMEQRGLAGFIVTSNENVFYTTGLPVTRGQVNPILFGLSNQFPHYAVIRPGARPSLVTWGGALPGHEFWVEDIRSAFVPGGTTEEALGLLTESFKGPAKLGIESSAPFGFVEKVKKTLPQAELVVAGEIFDDLRVVKSAAEIFMMKQSLEITERTVEALEKEMTSKMTTHQLIRRAEVLLHEFGAHGVDHATMALGTANPEIPDDVPAKSGDLAILDIGAILNGYVSDSRRLAFIGSLPADARELNGKMASIVTQTGMAARKGMTFSELCDVADAKHAEQKLEPMFISVGHTIGIQTEEQWITRDSQRKFEEGVVFNIEIYSRTESNLFIGTEDTFVVRAQGVEQLTRLPHEIFEVTK